MSAPHADAPTLILSIDPGRDKCGVAIVASQNEVLLRQIVARADVVKTIAQLWQDYQPSILVLGNATGSRQLETELHHALTDVPLTIIDERDSTLEARALYWAAYPPQGWRRAVPLSLQVPPVPLDDFAAVVLARRYLKNSSNT